MSAVCYGHGPNCPGHRVHESVYRRNCERFADACVVERDRFEGRSVMVLGGISHGLKSQLVVTDGNLTAARYRDEILRPHVIPLLQQHNLTLQQVLRTKSVTKKEMNKCMAEIYDPGGIRTRAPC